MNPAKPDPPCITIYKRPVNPAKPDPSFAILSTKVGKPSKAGSNCYTTIYKHWQTQHSRIYHAQPSKAGSCIDSYLSFLKPINAGGIIPTGLKDVVHWDMLQRCHFLGHTQNHLRVGILHDCRSIVGKEIWRVCF